MFFIFYQVFLKIVKKGSPVSSVSLFSKLQQVTLRYDLNLAIVTAIRRRKLLCIFWLVAYKPAACNKVYNFRNLKFT